MVKLDIVPLHDSNRNCFDDSIVTVSCWWGRSCELLFSEAWSFRFDTRGESPFGLMGSRINADPFNTFHTLEKYNGIVPKLVTPKGIHEMLGIIEYELSLHRPVVVAFDSFWSSWDGGYGKYHANHVLIISGIDTANQCVYCVDAFNLKPSCLLSMEQLKNGFDEALITFTLKENFRRDFCWRDIIKSALDKVYSTHSGINSFNAVRSFADSVCQINLSEELPPDLIMWSRPLYNGLKSTIDTRIQFIAVLKRLYENYNVKGLPYSIRELEEAASKWTLVFSLLIKGCHKPHSDKLLKKVSHYLKEIADKEESAAANLKALLNYGPEAALNPIRHSESIDYAQKSAEILCLDLKRHFNNRGFEFSVPEQPLPDFTGLNEYFLKDGLPSDRLWDVKNMRFDMSCLYGSSFDNLSCSQQCLTPPAAVYSALMILGCSEWGNYYENIIINYRDGFRESFSAYFSDWSEKCGSSQETVVWKGTALKTGNYKGCANLYAQAFCLTHKETIQSIIFPNCPNIHIFAVSLCQSPFTPTPPTPQA